MRSESDFVREVRFVENFMKFGWPLYRRLVKRHLANRCTKCCLSEAASALNNGLCGNCRSNSPGNQVSEKVGSAVFRTELDDLLKNATGPYQALALFSGGKDSTFLISEIQNRFPTLRVLALTIDTGFMSPVAMSNIKRVVAALNVDHVTLAPKRSFVEKMYRHAFTHLNEKGCAGTVDQFEGDFVFDMGRNFARDHGIPLVLGGISPIQVEENVGLQTFRVPAAQEAQPRRGVAGVTLNEVFTPDEMRNWWDGLPGANGTRPIVLFPFYAWGYDEANIKSLVKQRGLLPEGNHSPLMTNSQLIPLMTFVDTHRFGYSTFEPDICKLVRQGKADKQYWKSLFEMAEYSAKTNKFIAKSVDDMLERLSLTRKDLF